MRLKLLFEGEYQILGVMHGDECEADDFLQQGEATLHASRVGLAAIMQHIAENGLQNAPPVWVHEVNKKHGIYEFVKGDLRLFFFHGKNKQIAVCSAGVVKKGQKADKSAVKKAANLQEAYSAAVADQTLEVVQDEDE